MTLIKKIAILIFLSMIATIANIAPNKNNNPATNVAGLSAVKKEQSTIRNMNDFQALIENNIESYFDTDIVSKLPEELSNDDMISVIISMDADSLYDKYSLIGPASSFSEYASSASANSIVKNINQLIKEKLYQLNDSGIEYKVGETYNTLLAGFEVEIKAGDFYKLNDLFPNDTLILGETYEKCETEVVENYVNVYDTGIFDSSAIEYQGDMVKAMLNMYTLKAMKRSIMKEL